MNVIQSYCSTIIKGKFDLYEIRIFMKIVELANHVIKGKPLSAFIGKAFSADGINCNLTIPIKELLTENSHHYEEIKEALDSLKMKELRFYDPANKVYYSATLLNNIRIAQGDGLVRFTVPNWVMEYILNFITKNFSRYNLEAALALPTVNSVRLYWLTANMRDPVTINLKFLKELLGCGDKYKYNNDFIKRCIEPARKILQSRKLNGFRFEKIIEKNRCTKIKFYPIKRQQEQPNEITARATISAWVNPALRQVLTERAGFNADALSKNKALLFEFSSLETWQQDIVKIIENGRKQRAGIGYYINAMKNCVKQQHN